MRYFVSIDGVEHAVDVAELPGGDHEIRLLDSADADPASGRVLSARLTHTGQARTLQIGERVFDVVLEGALPEVGAWVSGRRVRATVESARMRAAGGVRGKSAGEEFCQFGSV